MKATITIRNGRAISNKYTSTEVKIFQQIFDGEILDNINIRIIFRRRNNVDFESTNLKSIKENINNYYNDDSFSEDSILKNTKFEITLSKELDAALTPEDYILYKTNPQDENFYSY